MASLTEVSDKTKKYTAICAGALVLFILIKLVFGFLGFVGFLINASAPIAANNGYGKIPNIQVNALPYNHSSKIQYILNTANGGFPVEPPIANVYKFKGVDLSLLSVDQAQKTARALGFAGAYTKVSDSIYDWKSGDKDFVYNINTNQFRIVNRKAYNEIVTDAGLQSSAGGISLTQAGAIQAAQTILKTLPMQSDYNVQNPNILYLNYSSSSNYPQVIVDGSAANAIRVIFYRSLLFTKINDNKILSNTPLTLLPDNPIDGSISITIDNDNASAVGGILEMDYSDWPIDTANYATYNIKNPQQAWQDVQDGNAYLVSLVKIGDSPFSTYQTQTVSKFEAENISLAYFDGVANQQYLEPVYIIKGTAILSDGTSADFYFYDPAII